MNEGIIPHDAWSDQKSQRYLDLDVEYNLESPPEHKGGPKA